MDIETTIKNWHVETFPNANKKAILEKAYEEIREFESESIHNYDAMYEEAADVAIVLYALCSRHGRSLTDLIEKKMEINKNRVWTNEDKNGGKSRVKK